MQTQLEPNLTSTSLGPSVFDASSSGKAIIVGEHAVVYGARAIAMPVFRDNMNVTLTPTNASDKPVQISMILGGRRVPSHIEELVLDAFEVLNVKPFSVKIEGDTKLPIGAGLGSSASLSIIILKAICGSIGKHIDKNQLAHVANCLERRFHGKPSGLDTAVVAHESVISFSKASGATPISVKNINGELPWKFLLIDSMVRSSTKAMIQVAAPYFTGANGADRIESFDKLAESTSFGLQNGSFPEVRDAMALTGGMLADAGVVNHELEQIIHACAAHGIPAAKPTGAGGGGAILALLDPKLAAAQTNLMKNTLSNLKIIEVELV